MCLQHRGGDKADDLRTPCVGTSAVVRRVALDTKGRCAKMMRLVTM